MCTECIVSRAQDFLIVSGAVAMVGVIATLSIAIGILLRLKKSIRRLDGVVHQAENFVHLPLKLLEHRLDGKPKKY